MSLQDELNIVQKITRITDPTRIKVDEIGWTSRTYVIDDGEIVFKFPRTDEDKQSFFYEVSALELIKQHKFAVNTPILNWSTIHHDYIGFFGVAGYSINQERISWFDMETKKRIGTELGLFLKQLHALEPPIHPYMMSIKDEIAEYQAKYKMALPTLELYFDAREIQLIDDLFMQTMSDEMLNLGEELVFCHGDLTYNNILLTNDDELGVIDFGDAGLYDRSKDFISLADRIVRDYAIKAYGSSLNLKAKIAIRQKLVPVLDILFYVGKNDLVGVTRCINLIKAGLS